MKTQHRSRPRALIVGEAPNRTGDPKRAIDGRCGARLAEFAGIPIGEFRKLFARVNLLDAWPGPSVSKGSAFPMAVAREEAARLSRRFVRERFVILLGHRVAAAFSLYGDYFQVYRLGWSDVVVVPHPSGVNRWFNDESNVVYMRQWFKRIIRRERRHA